MCILLSQIHVINRLHVQEMFELIIYLASCLQLMLPTGKMNKGNTLKYKGK